VKRQFHHREFESTDALIRKKTENGNTISVVLPTLNEAATIGTIVSYIRTHLTNIHCLVDEIIVIDGNSEDETVEIAAREGASVYHIDEIVPDIKIAGKGTALWKSQFVTHGDILVFIDTDIFDFDKRFINGLVGPLLFDNTIQFTKAFYKRPLFLGTGRYDNYGGRVTEILVRPFLSAMLPELSCVIQPLAGEYAIRRTLAENLPFWSGYGVEIGMLLDIFLECGLDAIAQVDMDDRHHRNRSVIELSTMSFGILHVMLQKFERMGKMSVSMPLYQTLQGISDSSSSQVFHDIELKSRNLFTKKEVSDGII